MREQDGDRLQPVLPDHLLDAGGGVLAGIDDHALLPGAGRHEIAVRTQASGWESGDKHARPTLRSAVRRFSLRRLPGAADPLRTHWKLTADF
ncbi:hypothetical protein GCM10009838_09500 [Catenulispora subtropica]|uniref:Uncharacterized protein n=1 Tax=Catenulispora subtropica TaxID=450798 RepID=A0ABN2QPM9_9ACTN